MREENAGGKLFWMTLAELADAAPECSRRRRKDPLEIFTYRQRLEVSWR
jgi:hypothetical protein